MKSLIILLVLTIFIEKSFQKLIFIEFNDTNLPNVPDNKNILQTRIVGGKPARPKQFPYQVGIFIYHYPKVEGSNPGSWCGGTLISNQYVLTAAHCFYNSGNLGDSSTIYLGAVDRMNPKEKGQRRIDVPARSWIIHQNYDDKIYHDDIALVRLPNQINFDDYVQPASLPKYSNRRSNFIKKQVFASGWGRTTDDKSSASDILQYIKINIVPEKECKSYPNYLPESQICLNSNGKSTCQGDSGGPHVLSENGRNTLIGITSYGNKQGCTKGFAVVSTRVTYYLDWIHQNSGIRIEP